MRHNGGMAHVEVVRDPESSRYEARVDGDLAGWIDYFARAGAVQLVHTQVLDDFAGKGIGSALVRHALDEIRSQGMAVIPTCEYAQEWIERHPAYADLVAQDTTG